MAFIPKRARLLRFVRALVMGLISAGSQVACGPSQPPASTSVQVNAEVPQWVFQNKPQHNKIAVVFVHGLFGGTLNTWTNANGKTFFELLKGAPDIGDKVDIFAFGFTSKMLAEGSLDIRQAATKLDQWLINQNVWDYDTVVFVAHSMGGLVVMQEVLDHPEKHAQVPLLMLYAVPQEGAQIAALARIFSANPALSQMFPADGSDFLKGLDHSWSLLDPKTRPTVICAYETASVQGIPVVSQFSATRYCDDAKVAIGGANHISIVKPDGPNHDSVITIENALHKYLNRQSSLEMPDFTPDGDALVYNFSDLLADNTARFVNNSPRPLRLTLGNTSDPKLSINPSKSPRDIASQQIDEIKIELLFRGTWQNEYRFTVGAPALPTRTVVVRLTDLKKIESQALALSEEVKGAVRDLQMTPQFRSLGVAQQQEEEAARVGRNVLMQRMPHVSAGLDWALTADALSTAGFKNYAVSALVKTAATSATNSPSVIFLTKSISEDFAPNEKYNREKFNRDRLDVLMREQAYIKNDSATDQQPRPPEINPGRFELDDHREYQLIKDEHKRERPPADQLEKERAEQGRHG